MSIYIFAQRLGHCFQNLINSYGKQKVLFSSRFLMPVGVVRFFADQALQRRL